MTVTVRSFAKINLGLRIGAPRADGFHDLLTVYQTIGLHDVIRISVMRGTGIEIRCADPRVPRDESNTCFRVVEEAIQQLGTKGRVVVEIEKRLPVQGGMGGASTNAIATLLGLERALKKSLPVAERLRIAAEVGSDLPLFLIGGTVLGVGRGEQVYPLEDLPAIACVVVTPEVGVSTPNAFAAWDRLCGAGALAREDASGADASDRVERPEPAGLCPARTGEGARPHMSRGGSSRSAGSSKLTLSGPSDRMIELSRALSAWLSEPYSGAPFGRGRAENPLLELVRAGIENDFERVVFPEYPELCEGKRALERAGAKYASLSGSGSTLYGLFASRQAAAKAATGLRKQGWAAQATVTLTRRSYWKRFFG
ncbi:MAG: 4-(cytidine 5'-diphospho)-2-C-methyl-D-erythritol kinase [Acidobacteriia bacterium]|nr:4-(cytidine 5'-diphospho)-2-C-methyl-D-erythritol kinase [Terriglobia bacterium]